MKNLKNLRIAYFNGTMIEGQDGVTRTLFRIVDFLLENEIESRFYSPLFLKSTEEKIDIVKVNSIKLPFYKDYHIPIPNRHNLTQNLDEFKPDILHIHSPCPLGKFAIDYGKKRNIPIFATYHTHFPSYSKYYHLELIEHFGWNYLKNIYNSCDSVFVPTKSIMSELEEHGFKNLIHLPNGIELGLFNENFKNPDWKRKIGAEDKKVLLFVGRLVWEKDLKILIQVEEELRKKRDDFVFVFVGDGPAQFEMKKKMKNAIFLGRKSGIELSEAYSSSDIFVFPSTTETFGIVILEAMASKLPVICVDKNGPKDLINDFQNGLLAKPDDASSFRKMIEILLDDEELSSELKANAFHFVQDFGWENIISKMFEHYSLKDSYSKTFIY